MGKKLLVAGSAVALFFSFITSLLMHLPVSAQSAAEQGLESITLSPTNKRYETLKPGQVIQDELTIVNDGATDYTFIAYAAPYSVRNAAYEPDFSSTPANADAYKWVQFQKAEYKITAGKSVRVPFTLRVPANAAPGGHYGVLFAETQPAKGNEQSVERKKRVGSLIYATVQGNYRTGGRSIGTEVDFLQFRPPLSVTPQVENTGNADFVASTTLRVSDVFGNVKHEETKPYTVLPETTRRIPLEWQQAPWFGLFKVESAVSFLDQGSNSSNYVLIAPRWLLIVVMAIIAGGGLYGVLHYHRRRRSRRPRT